ncbi:hypothetical protein ACFL3S_07845, partial [Gemmatimonadota bacterium]
VDEGIGPQGNQQYGLELRVANFEGTAADISVTMSRGKLRHPGRSVEEAQKVRDWGEGEYMKRARKDATTWILSHPGSFLWLTVKRIAFFWFGPLHRPAEAAGPFLLSLLALFGAWRILPRMTIPQRAVLLIPLGTYPLIYYVVSYISGYGEPLDWILYILGGAAVWGWLEAGSTPPPSAFASAA